MADPSHGSLNTWACPSRLFKTIWPDSRRQQDKGGKPDQSLYRHFENVPDPITKEPVYTGVRRFFPDRHRGRCQLQLVFSVSTASEEVN